jgi:hypothetical protein
MKNKKLQEIFELNINYFTEVSFKDRALTKFFL